MPFNPTARRSRVNGIAGWRAAPADGIFPDEFYATTHLPTQVRVHDQWVEVEGIEMDLGIRVDHDSPDCEDCSDGRGEAGRSGCDRS